MAQQKFKAVGLSAAELAALAIFEAMPRERIVAAIDEIGTTLKGSGIPFKERLRLNDDRHALRARLAQLDLID